MIVLIKYLHQQLELDFLLLVLKDSLNRLGVLLLLSNQLQEVGKGVVCLLLGAVELEGQVELGEFITNVEEVHQLIQRMILGDVLCLIGEKLHSEIPCISPPQPRPRG